MVINIAAFCNDPEIRKALIDGAKIRAEALNIAYSIPGYQGASLKTKNYIYDAINKKLSELI